MSEQKKTSTLAVAVAWLIVGIPAGWGVYNTALNARKLFLPSPVVQGVPVQTEVTPVLPLKN
ncbi:MAG: hypothetical protein P4L53_15930 [Candidatus Obscuribacterales bacterium]|nr:hypothetical protein [Candidatus Obscuribacterales bacterium]